MHLNVSHWEPNNSQKIVPVIVEVLEMELVSQLWRLPFDWEFIDFLPHGSSGIWPSPFVTINCSSGNNRAAHAFSFVYFTLQ